jgi:hypothetical protein
MKQWMNNDSKKWREANRAAPEFLNNYLRFLRCIEQRGFTYEVAKNDEDAYADYLEARRRLDEPQPENKNNIPARSVPLRTAERCPSSNALKLKHFFLGQTVDEINRLIPGFQDAYLSERSTPISSVAKQAGVTAFVDSTNILYKRPGVRQVPRKDYADTDFYWHFFEGTLYFLVVKYLDYTPLNLENFIRQVSQDNNLPVRGWTIHDKYTAAIQCEGFRVEVWTGQVVGSNFGDYPSVRLTDSLAEAEIEHRSRNIEKQNKNVYH